MDDIQELHAELSTQRLLLQEIYKTVLFRRPEARDEIKNNLLEGLYSVTEITTPALCAAPPSEVLGAVQKHIEAFFDDLDLDLTTFEQIPPRAESGTVD